MEIKRTWIVKTTLRNNKAGGIILPDFKPYYKTVVSESKHYSTSLVAQRLKRLAASALNAGDLGSMLGLGRSPGEGNGNPL